MVAGLLWQILRWMLGIPGTGTNSATETTDASQALVRRKGAFPIGQGSIDNFSNRVLLILCFIIVFPSKVDHACGEAGIIIPYDLSSVLTERRIA